MTDYAELRAALEAGPTPGPWKASQTGMRIEDAEGRLMYEAEWRPAGARKANAAYVASCDPDTIRALLAERDALDAECADLAHQLNQSNERNGVLRASLKECSAELFAQCGDQKRAMQYVERARAALAQEQGGSDGGQN